MINKTYILSIAFAYVLLGISFTYTDRFWFLFSLSLFLLIVWATFDGKRQRKRLTFRTTGYGILSGILIYLLFAVGKGMIVLLELPFLMNLASLYYLVSPKEWWHFAALGIIIIPGEELFWRGYIQHKLATKITANQAILISTLLYAGAHIFSGSLLLVLAAIVGGLCWGLLYKITENISVAILSHFVFDFLLLILLPLM